MSARRKSTAVGASMSGLADEAKEQFNQHHQKAPPAATQVKHEDTPGLFDRSRKEVGCRGEGGEGLFLGIHKDSLRLEL